MNWDTNSQYLERPYPAFPDPFPLGPSGLFIGGEYDLRPSFTPRKHLTIVSFLRLYLFSPLV